MADQVDVTMRASFKRWIGPNFATTLSGGSVHVRDLEPHVLDAMAQAWLEDLYRKTGRPAPRISHAD